MSGKHLKSLVFSKCSLCMRVHFVTIVSFGFLFSPLTLTYRVLGLGLGIQVLALALVPKTLLTSLPEGREVVVIVYDIVVVRHIHVVNTPLLH